MTPASGIINRQITNAKPPRAPGAPLDEEQPASGVSNPTTTGPTPTPKEISMQGETRPAPDTSGLVPLQTALGTGNSEPLTAEQQQRAKEAMGQGNGNQSVTATAAPAPAPTPAPASGVTPNPPPAVPPRGGTPEPGAQPPITGGTTDIGRQLPDGTVVGPTDPRFNEPPGRGTTPRPGRNGIINGATTPTPSAQTQTPNAAAASPGALPASSNPTASGPAAAPGAATDPNAPVTRQVADNETVRGQIKALLDEGSPLLESAKARAMQYASSRGLVNSAIAAQSGEEALINTATPIATADAGTFSRQGLTNQDVQNQANAANKQREYEAAQNEKNRQTQLQMTGMDVSSRESVANIQAGIAGAQIAANTSMAANEIAARDRQQAADLNSRLTIAGLDVDSRNHLAEIDINSRRDLNMSTLQQNTLTNYGNQVAQIQSNPNMSTADKDTAIRNLNGIYAGSPYLPISIDFTSHGTTPPPSSPPPPQPSGDGG